VRVLLIGSGGREHALGWKLARSGRVAELLSLPGNPGLRSLGPVIEGVSPSDPGAVAAVARLHRADLVVVGPEAPLAAGVVDALARLGIPAFGPSRAAARLESSKAFAKQVMVEAGVPTAAAWTFTERGPALAHLAAHPGPYVVKADGLAAGKGVLVTADRAAAAAWVDRCLGGGFGAAGSTVVIEEHLAGPEVSVFALCAGEEAVVLEPARDYKRLGDGDTGPNTGGMGCYSPVPDLPPGLPGQVVESVLRPVLRRLVAAGTPYTGFLYAGLVLTTEGPRVLEFNVRLGDPETQVVLPRLEDDLIDLLEAALGGRLAGVTPRWSPAAAVDVVLAAAGYPEAAESGVPVGLPEPAEDVLVFHSGTAIAPDGMLVSAGGRVLNLVGLGGTLDEAREKAYAAARRVRFAGAQMRTDIAASPLAAG
jgi:phosphoribosylamine--glycine ligase